MPAELLGAARRRADPEVELRRRPERRRRGRAARCRSSPRRPRRRPRTRAPGRRGTTRSSKGERDAHGQTSSASSSIATRRSLAAHLLGRDVAQQVAAHRALVVGGGALALARDLGGHERQGVELRVGVLERGAGRRALVDDQVDVGRVGRGPASARASAATAAASRSSESRQRGSWRARGALTITSCAPVGRLRCEQARLGCPRRVAPAGRPSSRQPARGRRACAARPRRPSTG